MLIRALIGNWQHCWGISKHYVSRYITTNQLTFIYQWKAHFIEASGASKHSDESFKVPEASNND